MWEAVSPDTPLVIVGCGKMGSAMARGWLSSGLPESNFLVVDPVAAQTGVEGVGCNHIFPSLEDLPTEVFPSIIVLAVKPQIVTKVLPSLARLMTHDPLIISVAAGIKLDSLQDALGDGVAAVRAMPNTPAAIGKGITALVANSNASQDQKRVAEGLMRAAGKTVWLEREDQMNAVTALSGSGPAYVFHMVEAMAAAGVVMGLDDDLAMKLARETVIGAGYLLDSDSKDASKLREEVTSPGGTTAAGLEVLRGGDTNLSMLMRSTLRAAKKRGEELG